MNYESAGNISDRFMNAYRISVSKVISSVIVKEERRGEIEIPEIIMTQIFQRIEDKHYWPMMLQLLVENVDPSYEEFEDNINTVTFMMDSIIQRIGKSKNVSKCAKIFETWLQLRVKYFIICTVISYH